MDIFFAEAADRTFNRRLKLLKTEWTLDELSSYIHLSFNSLFFSLKIHHYLRFLSSCRRNKLSPRLVLTSQHYRRNSSVLITNYVLIQNGMFKFTSDIELRFASTLVTALFLW